MAVAVCALALAGCSRAGEPVAQAIEESESPLILRVEYLAQSPFGQVERVLVYLKPETTEALAREFWCEVVAPAGGEAVDTTVYPGDPPTGSYRFTSYESRPNYPNYPECSS